MQEERAEEEVIDATNGDGFGGEGHDLHLGPVAVTVCIVDCSCLKVEEVLDGESDGEELGYGYPMAFDR